MNQHEMAERLGLTFQQVQKYERSENRISASRPYEVARILGVPVAYFFSGIDDDQATVYAAEIDAKVMRIMQSAEGRKWLNSFHCWKTAPYDDTSLILSKSFGETDSLTHLSGCFASFLST
ncbi:helix-turn-helix domain-containing protein [Asticcacaulis solisilvae]|uniref:helix-turn-helix domain-containing protein n=1 Tax=Asticcacaulis solisilvae TaxID=1217274 RepID=UPI003FD85D95